jgi:RNA recognition motif-containing protein
MRRPSRQELYVSNLPKTFSVEQVKELFNEFGTILAIRMPKNERGEAKGIAFIDYEESCSIKKALDMNGKEVGGRVIVISVADPKMNDTPKTSQTESNLR